MESFIMNITLVPVLLTISSIVSNTEFVFIDGDIIARRDYWQHALIGTYSAMTGVLVGAVCNVETPIYFIAIAIWSALLMGITIELKQILWNKRYSTEHHIESRDMYNTCSGSLPIVVVLSFLPL